MEKTDILSESMENYLEVILDLESESKVARSKDIAERLGIKRGSVSWALKALKEKGLINYRPYSFITLTDEGRTIAEEIARRHDVLRDFLRNILQIDSKTAEETACRMEHAVDEKTMRRLTCFIEYIHICPRAGDQWLESFIEYCQTKEHSRKKCDTCIETLKPMEFFVK